MAATRDVVKDYVSRRKQIFAHREDGNKNVVNVYNDWAETYDEDHVVLGYKGPTNVVEVASEFIQDKSSRILDAASGTGLVGKELKGRGFTCIDALDASRDSLNASKRNQSYKEYICDTLDEHQTEISDDRYDAVIMCAAFGAPGHVSAACFPELVRITKPGGYIMFTFAENFFDQWDKAEADIQAISNKGLWKVVEYRMIPYITNDAIPLKAKLTVLRVVKNGFKTNDTGC